MNAPPLCRYCGKPLRKWTERLWCYREEPSTEAQRRVGVVGVFRSRAELQTVTNKQVVSIDRYLDNQHYREKGLAGMIHSFGVWDGETYESVSGAGYFDTQRCAVAFARLVVREIGSAEAYRAALRAE